MNRLARCWLMIESMIVTITEPRADISASDAEFARLAESSVLGAGFGAAEAAVAAGWAHSASRRFLSIHISDAQARTPAANIRVASWAAIVAATTVLCVQVLTFRTIEVWISLCPVLVIALGVAAFTAADPIERALKGRNW